MSGDAAESSVLAVQDLRVRYGRREVLRGLRLQVARGGVYALPYAPLVQVDDSEVVVGSRVRVYVELTDTDGIQVTDQRWVTAVAP